jgi:hypothetical protein
MAFPASNLGVDNYPLHRLRELDPDSAVRLRRLLSNAITSMLRTVLDHSDAARVQWQTASRKYRERWAQGELDAVTPVLSDLLAWLRRAGIDPAGHPDIVALSNDPAVKRIRGRTHAVENDKSLLEMFRQVASAIAR